MCGICGIAYPSRLARPVDREVVDRMRDVLAHRGPDAAGSYVCGPVGLGHRRLSIVDVAAGHQPMASDDGALHIVYNGEVYNHPALRRELEERGHVYRTRCDTESVLRAFQEFGADAPTRLRGMFAVALWDARTRTLLLARDRFGVKPLYYVHAADGSIAFASEIKALVAGGRVVPALNLASLPDYLANHAPSGDETLYAGVRRVPPGHTLAWHDGAVTLRRYWDLDFTPNGERSASDRDLVAEYRERFTEAVRLRLMADVPLGVFLSGGIDSAAITATMSAMIAEPVRTFSVAFAEREANELRWARLVAERCRTEHREVLVSPGEFFAALPRLVWHEDEPIAHPSSVALYFVSRLAAAHVKVVLTGEGSDECLAGYNRYRATVYNVALGRSYARAVPSALRALLRRELALESGDRWRARARRSFLAHEPTLDALYFDNFAVFSRARQAALLAPATRAALGATDPYAAARRHLGAASGAATLLDRLLYADTKTYLHELLMKQDQMSMAASIESRVPFLDHPLAEFTARLPQRLKLRGLTSKWVLRRAMRGRVPDEILTRRKMGFPVPIGAWLRGPFTHLLDEYVTGPRAAARALFAPAALRDLVAAHRAGTDHAQRLWALITLEMWQRTCIDGEAGPPDLTAPTRSA